MASNPGPITYPVSTTLTHPPSRLPHPPPPGTRYNTGRQRRLSSPRVKHQHTSGLQGETTGEAAGSGSGALGSESLPHGFRNQHPHRQHGCAGDHFDGFDDLCEADADEACDGLLSALVAAAPGLRGGKPPAPAVLAAATAALPPRAVAGRTGTAQLQLAAGAGSAGTPTATTTTTAAGAAGQEAFLDGIQHAGSCGPGRGVGGAPCGPALASCGGCGSLPSGGVVVSGAGLHAAVHGTQAAGAGIDPVVAGGRALGRMESVPQAGPSRLGHGGHHYRLPEQQQQAEGRQVAAGWQASQWRQEADGHGQQQQAEGHQQETQQQGAATGYGGGAPHLMHPWRLQQLRLVEERRLETQRGNTARGSSAQGVLPAGGGNEGDEAAEAEAVQGTGFWHATATARVEAAGRSTGAWPQLPAAADIAAGPCPEPEREPSRASCCGRTSKASSDAARQLENVQLEAAGGCPGLGPGPVRHSLDEDQGSAAQPIGSHHGSSLLAAEEASMSPAGALLLRACLPAAAAAAEQQQQHALPQPPLAAGAAEVLPAAGSGGAGSGSLDAGDDRDGSDPLPLLPPAPGSREGMRLRPASFSGPVGGGSRKGSFTYRQACPLLTMMPALLLQAGRHSKLVREGRGRAAASGRVAGQAMNEVALGRKEAWGPAAQPREPVVVLATGTLSLHPASCTMRNAWQGHTHAHATCASPPPAPTPPRVQPRPWPLQAVPHDASRPRGGCALDLPWSPRPRRTLPGRPLAACGRGHGLFWRRRRGRPRGQVARLQR